MPPQMELVQQWLKKANADLLAASQLQGNPALTAEVCFHCQQCAEKYLKALTEELGLAVPKIHYLDQLLTALLPHHPTLRPLRRGLLFLSVFAVDTRYPGDSARRFPGARTAVPMPYAVGTPTARAGIDGKSCKGCGITRVKLIII